MIQLENGWIEIKPIKKSQYTEEVHIGYATRVDSGNIYYEGVPVCANDKYFIKEEQLIAFEDDIK